MCEFVCVYIPSVFPYNPELAYDQLLTIAHVEEFVLSMC